RALAPRPGAGCARPLDEAPGQDLAVTSARARSPVHRHRSQRLPPEVDRSARSLEQHRWIRVKERSRLMTTHVTSAFTQLPLPPHYDPANAGRWEYSPDQMALFQGATEWRRQHEIQPSAAASFDLHLLLIDVQKDFCFPQGTLYVGGRSGTGAI